MRTFLIITLLALTSCSLQRKLNKYCPLCVQEISVNKTIIYRDTTIITPGETLTITDTLYCDSLGNVLSKLNNIIRDKNGKILNLQTSLNNNIYTSRATVDTVYTIVKGNTIIEKEITYIKGKEVRIKYIPWWVNFLAVIGTLVLIILIIRFTIKYLKK